MRTITALLLVAALACAGAARVPDDMFITSDTASGGLRSSALGLLGVMRDVERQKGECAYANIRFFVPPGEQKHFENIWMDLEKDVMDMEKRVQFFDLKKTRTDNVIYHAYGEWESHKDLRDHLMSKHFEDFADEVDKHEVRWELQLLKSMSTEYEMRHAKRPGMDEPHVEKKRGMHHILITYIVPPGEAEGFTDAWMDCAESTLDEKRNRNYALRKLATDNERFYHYGTWDSMSDWMDHFESKHFGNLLDYTDKKDIIYFIQPLMKIGHESE